MSYRIISMRGHHGESEAEEFFHAAEKARKAVEKMRSLAEEMEDRYSERYYGDRGMYGYGMREHHPMYDGYGEREMWDSPEYHERRRRDSMGRYM